MRGKFELQAMLCMWSERPNCRYGSCTHWFEQMCKFGSYHTKKIFTNFQFSRLILNFFNFSHCCYRISLVFGKTRFLTVNDSSIKCTKLTELQIILPKDKKCFISDKETTHFFAPHLKTSSSTSKFISKIPSAYIQDTLNFHSNCLNHNDNSLIN